MWRKCNEGGGARTRDLGIKSRGAHPAEARQATAPEGNRAAPPHPTAPVGHDSAEKSQRKSQTLSYKEGGTGAVLPARHTLRAGLVAYLRTHGGAR